MTRTLRIGTRGSALALVQARWTAARLADQGVSTELVIIRTDGDDRAPGTTWGEGAFVTRIVAALLSGEVDVAVHSAKDLPTDEAPALVVAAFPPREDPRDAIVARVRGMTLATLPPGARVGTDSPRRVAFLRAARPDLRLHPLHGNVDTRLAKLDAGESDALVLAVAGLTRLGRADRIDEILDPDTALPAPGQGALAIQVRVDDAVAIATVARLDDPATRTAVEAERALLSATGGGCRAPLGTLATVAGGHVTIRAGAARSLPRAATAADLAPRMPDLAAQGDAPAALPATATTTSIVRVEGTAAIRDAQALAQALAGEIVALAGRPAPSPEGEPIPTGNASTADDTTPMPIPTPSGAGR
jgi:hydroxymethylbilane synthase